MFYLFVYTIMNNINIIDRNNNHKKSNGWRNLWYTLMIAWLLNVNTPYANSNNYKNITTEQVKSDSNSINWIELPTIYQNRLDDFLANNNVMKDSGTKKFTIDFVEKEMKTDWWISKENQLLFIRHSIYKQVTDQDLYDGKDGDQKIAEDFSNKVINVRIRACWQKYRSLFTAYMQQRSADADRRSADADRRSADADKNIMHNDSIRLKKNMIEFYEIYIRDPNAVKKEDIDFARESTKKIIATCKGYWIDYRAILLKEVWDKRKVDEILKFYGVE